MRLEQGALTKSGKTFGVRSFYNFKKENFIEAIKMVTLISEHLKNTDVIYRPYKKIHLVRWCFSKIVN
jgi:hypothetical protein